MPQPIPQTLPAQKRLKDFQEVSLGFPKKVTLEEARRCPQCHEPPCVPGCPLGIDIPGFIRLLREGDPVGAFKKIKEQNEFPSLCGRVCFAPCERICVLEKEEAPIGIRALERFAADHGRHKVFPGKKPNPTGKKVAIIGSGPAGLTAAVQLARKNYQVTIFEALPKAGGILRYGIPEFRLPKLILDSEIEEVRSLGVDILTSCLIGENLTLDELFQKKFEAILLSVGTGSPQVFEVPGTNFNGVYYAKMLLMQINFSPSSLLKNTSVLRIGQRMAVIGANPSALDTARVCLRLDPKKEVHLIFDTTHEDMRIHPQDREEAKKEGIKLEGLTRVLEILGEDNKVVSGLRCIRLDFADPNKTGKWELIPVPDSEFDLNVDTVIIAEDYQPNLRWRQRISGLKWNEDGTLWTDLTTAMTSHPGIFAAGDVTSLKGDIVKAMADGKKAAAGIDQYLKIKSK